MCTFIAVRLLLLFRINILGATGSSITSVRNVSIECKSERYGVVFKFQEQKSSDYIRLAECQFGPGGHSQLMDETFKGTYDVTYVNYTCVLTILYLTVDQCGIYTCAEMYNESETVEKQIGWNCEGVPKSTETTEGHWISIIVVLSVGCVVLAGSSTAFIVHFHFRRKNNQHTSNENRQELGDFSEAAPLTVPQTRAGNTMLDEESSTPITYSATDTHNASVDDLLAYSHNLNMTPKDTLTGDITQDDGQMSFTSQSIQNNIEQQPENTPKILEVRNDEHRHERLQVDDPEKESPVEERDEQTTPKTNFHQTVAFFESGEAKHNTSRSDNSEERKRIHEVGQSRLVSNTNQELISNIEKTLKKK
ncbi:uncharacterized protein LOC127867339 isoform X2 [Dreissena polymorpha]|uniref:uncharacterized protein LOC127865701 isoform X2 n=1 Tax=Dreissena polymorpha TaxID=45954 RepID=UPI002264B422|nr:uncharacterized protein LOC127865701 isoform X2 [Dreissena polymorpha]XP_052264386.1 uncharacterized protein LOC127867339 isoform X2 [Dreissena polymorpha]